jgi:hypothetical protein
VPLIETSSAAVSVGDARPTQLASGTSAAWFTDVESELQQLAMDARRTRGRGIVRHLPDEASDRDVDARPTGN